MEFHKIGIAADHAGKELKQEIFSQLESMDLEVVDYGVSVQEKKSVDYPDYSRSVAEAVARKKLQGAIAVCGTGIGMAMTANKFPGVRAVCAWDEYSTRMARMHNNANVLCLGGRTLNYYRAIELVKIWLETPFAGDRHAARLDKIKSIEDSFFRFD